MMRWIAARFFNPAYTAQMSRGRLLRALIHQKLLGFNRRAPYPVHHTVTVSDWTRLHLPPTGINNLQSPGCYWQNFAADITIGEGVYIGPNVGIITANHNPDNPAEHLDPQPVTVGDGCWIGMNTVILPGVTLGPNTTVGAGSVVTRSHNGGTIAGAPAQPISTKKDRSSSPTPQAESSR